MRHKNIFSVTFTQKFNGDFQQKLNPWVTIQPNAAPVVSQPRWE